ncbi:MULTISPECIES: hypothetical protein [Lactococcus]|uniref:hypothetical protein n=1 Tax=Lactococcus TaxID=1357 RepID=UPI00203CFFCC|nr:MULTISPECIES: hypothetical protein [Lactococcus]
MKVGNLMYQGSDNYGVPRDIFAKFKMGIFYGLDFGFMAIGGGFAWWLNRFFPVSQWLNMLIFDVLTAIIVIFLIMHTNGGKRNYMVLLLFLRTKTSRIKRQFKPLKKKAQGKEIEIDANF